MAKKYPGLYLYYDWIEVLEKMPPKKAMTIIKNLRNFARDGIEPPPMAGQDGCLQDLLVAQMKRSIANSEHGRQGGLLARKKADATRENLPSEKLPHPIVSPERIDPVGLIDYTKFKARMDAEMAALSDSTPWNDSEELPPFDTMR